MGERDCDKTVSLDGIPVNINRKTLQCYVNAATSRDVCLVIAGVIGAIFYVTFEPLLHIVAGLVFLLCPSQYMASVKHPCILLESNGVTRSAVRERVCAKTGRTFITRMYDPARDSVEASQVVAAAFAVDPFHQYMFPDVNLRHSFGYLWYQTVICSMTSDVVVQEWKEQEKLVGVLVMSQRKPTLLTELFDNIRLAAFFFRSFPYLAPGNICRMLLMVLGVQQRYAQALEPYGESGSAVKFLAVEKGFQGQGIGSHLLETVTRHFDKTEKYSYLESSNIVNVPLYRRFGYVLFEQYHPTADAPPQYLMIRKPKCLSDSSPSTTQGATSELSPWLQRRKPNVLEGTQ